jgi:hypothetical protein
MLFGNRTKYYSEFVVTFFNLNSPGGDDSPPFSNLKIKNKNHEQNQKHKKTTQKCSD